MARSARGERGSGDARLSEDPPAAAIVERAKSSDLDALAAIDVLLVPRERQDDIVRASVAAGTCLVARVGPSGATLAGYVTWDRTFFGRAFVWLLVVAPSHRRAGIARALLAAVERETQALGELFISTESINAPMRALLDSLGYERSGALEHINAPGNPELVFRRLFDASE